MITSRAIGLLALLCLPAAVRGEPPARAERFSPLAQEAPLEFRYTETRRLELMDAPWKGSGYLYSTPEGTLVKLQIAPERLIMAIVGDTMVYYESSSQRRQTAPLSFAGPMVAQIQAFRAIIQGRLGELEGNFHIDSSAKDERWALRLQGKPQARPGTPASIEMSGDEKQRKRQIRLRQADGDATEYILEQNRQGAALAFPIRQLISEATGK